MKNIARAALFLRTKLANHLTRLKIPKDFTIISDDCWGGQLYRQLQIPYLTPTVGLYVSPQSYLNFVDQILSDTRHQLRFKDSDFDFPVADYGPAELFFKHYTTEEHAEDAFHRRYSRINRKKLYIKADLGKPGTTLNEIQLWNNRQLPNSVAFYSRDTPIPESGIHNGVLIDDWIINGADMFNLSRRYFDIIKWLNTGKIESSLVHLYMNYLLLDPTAPKRSFNKFIRGDASS